MKHKSGANYAKIAVIAVALAVAATCTVSGTLAAFSATYTWNSDSASAGDIGFRDTVYSFGLFNNSFIVPGDSGSATLTGADFGGHAVEWTFESHNENAMPVVFYSLDEEGNPDFSSFYSDGSPRFRGLRRPRRNRAGARHREDGVLGVVRHFLYRPNVRNGSERLRSGRLRGILPQHLYYDIYV